MMTVHWPCKLGYLDASCALAIVTRGKIINGMKANDDGSACIPSSCGGRCSSYRPRGGVFERPCSRAAEQRYERAALHSITSSAMASTPGGIVKPSVLAVLRLITSSLHLGREQQTAATEVQ